MQLDDVEKNFMQLIAAAEGEGDNDRAQEYVVALNRYREFYKATCELSSGV